jgi:hypothetical protein
MADVEEQHVAPAAAAAPAAFFKLAPFWPNSPGTWFAQAEGQFHLRNVTGQLTRYYMVLAALPEATVDLVADLVESELPVDPYDELRRRLLQAHTLTPYQQVEQLFAHPSLGDQRPSELLAAMLKKCPRGQEDSPFFRYLFLHRLPRELRVLLSDVDGTDRRVLAERADHLWSHNVRGHSDTVAAAVPEDVVAAVRGRSRNRKKHPSTPQQQQQSSRPAVNVGRQSGGGQSTGGAAPYLCFFHGRFKERAHRCEGPPCTWQEN